jgi:hypothetical protein
MVVTEQRVQVAPTRVRIQGLALNLPKSQPEVLVDPLILVIQVLSPDDSYSRDERARGSYGIWIIDPKTRSGQWCTSGSLDLG